MNDVDKKVAYIGGTFEVPHLGHANLIRRVQALGFEVVVAVNGDRFVFENRGYVPLYDEFERMGLVNQLGVETVVVPTMFSQGRIISRYSPDVIVLGMDWFGKDLHKQFAVEEGFFEANKIGFLFLPRTPGVSSSELKRRLKDE